MARAEATVSEALVLRVIPFGETSQVVHLATPDHGLVAALAKGALRPGSEVEGGLTPFAQGTAWWKPPTRRDDAEGLVLLSRFRQRDAWRGLGALLARYQAACYVLELARLWMKPALAQPALYRAAVTVLRALAGAPEELAGAWVVWFEARAAAAAGQRPALEICPGCGLPVSGALVFSPAVGGVAHAACARDAPTRRLTSSGFAALTRLYTQRLKEFAAHPPSPAEVRLLRALHDLWIPWQLERRPQALDHLPR